MRLVILTDIELDKIESEVDVTGKSCTYLDAGTIQTRLNEFEFEYSTRRRAVWELDMSAALRKHMLKRNIDCIIIKANLFEFEAIIDCMFDVTKNAKNAFKFLFV